MLRGVPLGAVMCGCWRHSGVRRKFTVGGGSLLDQDGSNYLKNYRVSTTSGTDWGDGMERAVDRDIKPLGECRGTVCVQQHMKDGITRSLLVDCT